MKKSIIFFLLCLIFNSTSFAMENAFYILHSHSPGAKVMLQKSSDSLSAHSKFITILSPQAYQINERGELMGYINSNVFQCVKDHSIKITPMVTNRRFDKVETQKL